MVERPVTSRAGAGPGTPALTSTPTCRPSCSTIHEPTTWALRTLAAARYSPDGFFAIRMSKSLVRPATVTLPRARSLSKVAVIFDLSSPVSDSLPACAVPFSQASTRLPSQM